MTPEKKQHLGQRQEALGLTESTMRTNVSPDAAKRLLFEVDLQRAIVEWEVAALRDEVTRREEMLMDANLKYKEYERRSHICPDCGRECYCLAADYVGSDCEHDCEAEARQRAEDSRLAILNE